MASTMCAGIGGRPEMGRVRSSLFLLVSGVFTGAFPAVVAGCSRVVGMGVVGLPSPAESGADGCS